MEKENLNEPEEEKVDNNEGKVLEVASKKIIIGGKVLTITKRRDINDTIGEELNRNETKESLITAVKRNGEEAKQEEKEKSKFKAKYLVPILAVIMLPLMLRSCNSIEDVPKEDIEYRTIPIEIQVYDLENPYKELEGIVGLYGQEGMTANWIEGDSFEGEHYSSDEHFDAEKQASSGVTKFQDMKNQVEYNIQILTDQSSTQDQKYEAAKNLLDLQKEAEKIYINNEPMAEEYTKRFKEASEAYKDSNTENEKIGIDLMYEGYMSELGLASYNIAEIEEIVSLCEQGYELNVKSEKELDGDYEITGEAVKEVIKEQNINESKSIWQKFANFVKGRSDKAIER